MILHRVELTNFFQYERLELDFAAGVVGIAGPNRVGKSHLLDGIAGSLTNDFGRPKAKCLRWNIPARAPARVVAEWTIAEQRFRVERDLKGTDSKLIAGDQEPILGTTAVQEWIRDLLKMPETVIELFIFIRQNALGGLLTGKKAERIAGFISLCGIAQASKLHAVLGEELRAFYGDVTDVDTAAVDEMHRRHRGLEVKIKQLEKELQGWEEKAGTAEWRTAYDRGLQALRRRNESREELAAAATEVTAAAAAYAGICETQESSVRVDDAAIAELERQAAACRTSIDLEQRRMKIQQTIDQPLPPEPEDPALLEERLHLAMARQAAIAGELAGLNRRLDLLDHGLTECETCGQSLVSDQDDEARLRADRDLVLTNVQRSTRDTAAARTAYKAGQEAWNARKLAIAALTASRRQLRELGPSEMSLDAAKQKLPGLGKAQADAAIARKRYAELERAAAAADAKLQAATARRDRALELIQTAEALMTDAKDVCEVAALSGAVLRDAKDAATKAAGVAGQCAALAEERDFLAKSLADLERRATQEAPRRRLKECLVKIREQCHPEALPREVVLRKLGKLTWYTNEYLHRLGEDFDVRISDDLAFQAVYPGGIEDDAEGFSFAQKSVTAISFLLAANKVFAGVCDFMSLDEPASGFDEEHLTYFAGMLSQLDRVLRTENRQILVVTHDRRILDALPQKIVLTGSDG